MKFVVISDTHGEFPNPASLPEADFFIHCGDITNIGIHGDSVINSAKSWFIELSKRYGKVFAIQGNHDIGISNSLIKEWGAVPLNQRISEYEGIKLGGVSLTVAYNKPSLIRYWDYMTTDDRVEQYNWDFEPVDIVVSHGPPYGVLDKTYDGDRIGSIEAQNYIIRHSPKYFVCGHVHESAGKILFRGTQVVNTAMKYQILEI